jgi:transposase, IS5 family
LLRLPDDLARVDALLDDPAFFEPFAPHFHPVLGRSSTPAECYLRLMTGGDAQRFKRSAAARIAAGTATGNRPGRFKIRTPLPWT